MPDDLICCPACQGSGSVPLSREHAMTLAHLRRHGPTTPCLWFQKGQSKPARWLPDTVISYGNTAGVHKWNKNPEAYSQWLQAFTEPGDLAWDPFTGGGTVPSVCKSLGRHFIASEIDPDTADRARQRLRNTMPPLLLPEPEPPLTLALEIEERTRETKRAVCEAVIGELLAGAER